MFHAIKRLFSQAKEPAPVPSFILYARSASDAAEQEEYQLARELYTKAIGLAPDVADLYSGRALACKALGLLDEALADLNRAIELGATDMAEMRTHLYATMENHEEAVKGWTLLLAEDPQNHALYLFRGQSYGHLGNTEAALADLEKVRELDPEEIEAYISLSACYGQAGRPEEVVAISNLGLTYEWYCPELLLNKAFALTQLKRYAEALECYTLLLEKTDWRMDVFYNRGRMYLEIGQPEDALRDLEEVVFIDPEDGEVYLQIGCIYEELGNRQQALEAFRKAQELDVEDAARYIEKLKER